MPTRSRKAPRQNVISVLGLQPLQLVEGDELDTYATEFSPDENQRAGEQARKYMRLPELLDATLKASNDEPA